MMNAGTIVGYITRPNGSPISGAEIWICETTGAKDETQNPSARTDARGYFRLTLASGEAGINEVFGGAGNLKVSVGKRRDVRANGGNDFRVTGYLVNETP